jgi:excisionase family DNA binding protein
MLGIQASTSSMFLTAAEVAELLRTSPKAVYTMIERGQLPGVHRLGRRVLVKRSELLDWLDHKCTPSSQENRR